MAAYELLACSVAIPRPGRNKEIALHILMENQGNLQAAVMDLLRSDTLDWEQYPIIYNNLYTDVDVWTPEEVVCFQDAIYKSEKDFLQVATELNRPLKECVAFYYLWKKTCPDDYRKLRNLRRKRQLLEQQIDFAILSQSVPSKAKSGGDSTDDVSETESDITMEGSPPNNEPWTESLPLNASQLGCFDLNEHINMPSTSGALTTNNSFKNLNLMISSSNFAASGQAEQFGYPWLHGENGLFPSPNISTNSSSDPSHQQPILDKFAEIGVYNDMSTTNTGLFEVDNGDGKHDFLHKFQRVHSATLKKGAQPANDGFFHCRLCEKKFEKVKSLNAHMKSHAMKARAEAQLQQPSPQKLLLAPSPTETAFQPYKPAKSEITVNGSGKQVTSPSPALNSMGPLNLSSPAMAAALSRIQQQQHHLAAASALSAQPILQLRNMLQQHVYGNTTTTNDWLNPPNQFTLPGSQ